MEELFYIIDKEQSDKDNALVIRIQPGERDGLQIKLKKLLKPLTHESANRLASAKDKELLPFLLNEEQSFAKINASSQSNATSTENLFVRISHAATPQALKLFASAGRLYYNGKQIVIDLYGKAEFYYFADTSANVPVLEGRIKTNAQDFEIASCDFMGKGPPHWFIKGISLKFISTEASWTDLKSACERRFRPFHELLEEARSDAQCPRVVSSSPILKIQEREPLPLVILKDRLGAFADLWMDYGPPAIPIAMHDHSGIVVDAAGLYVCKRQNQAELGWEKDLLETNFIKKQVDAAHYYCPVDKVSKSIAFLLEMGWQVRDWKGNVVMLHTHAELNAEAGSQNIAVRGKLHYGTFQADLADIIGAFNRRERFVQIAPGCTALLPNSWEKEGFDALAEEGEIVSGAVQMKKNRIGSLSTLFESHTSLGLDASLKQLKDSLATFQGIKTAAPGHLFSGNLRPYQQEGVNWLAFLYDFGFHGILADDMGLGKTAQTLAFISRLEITSPILIVMPTSLLFNWRNEIEKFLSGISYTIHHGPLRTQRQENLDKPHIILTTYATLRNDFPLLSQMSYQCVILDEAQAIKNAQTQTAQTVRQLQSRFRLSITGTPIENHVIELWSHFHFLMPDLFDTQETFRGETEAGLHDPRFLKRIKKKLRPFLLRRCKEEVAKELPEKIEQTVWVEMGEEQRRVYDGFLSGIRRGLIKKVQAEGASKHRLEILEAIMRLRQICCHPLLVNSETSSPDIESAKLEVLIDDLATAIAEGRKVLVYSQFTSMLSLIGKRLKECGWRYAYLDGSTQNREKVVTEFQEDSSIPLFLISLKAGGIGLNLTAADYVYLYDPWWNNAVENQAIDRAHRIGRKDTVIAKRLVILESIEEKMMKLKAAKTSLADGLLASEEESGLKFSIEDLLFLLG